MTATARTFAALAAKINEPNPRIAAGLSPQAWERARKARRRAEWLARASTHAATAVATKPVRDFVPFEDAVVQRLRDESCLDRGVPLEIQPPARPERGETVAAYYSRKWRRFGSLGEYEALNPYLDSIRRGQK
jgi:hypothetical protein